MCVGAMVHARVGLVVYGATEPKAGAVLSMTRAHEPPALNHRLQVLGGVLEAECRELIQGFFSQEYDEGSDYRWKPGYRGGDRGARASSRPSSEATGRQQAAIDEVAKREGAHGIKADVSS